MVTVAAPAFPRPWSSTMTLTDTDKRAFIYAGYRITVGNVAEERMLDHPEHRADDAQQPAHTPAHDAHQEPPAQRLGPRTRCRSRWRHWGRWGRLEQVVGLGGHGR